LEKLQIPIKQIKNRFLNMENEKQPKWKNVNISSYLVDEIDKKYIKTGKYTSIPRFIEFAIRSCMDKLDKGNNNKKE
jgi:hypothetical protein